MACSRSSCSRSSSARAQVLLALKFALELLALKFCSRSSSSRAQVRARVLLALEFCFSMAGRRPVHSWWLVLEEQVQRRLLLDPLPRQLNLRRANVTAKKVALPANRHRPRGPTAAKAVGDDAA